MMLVELHAGVPFLFLFFFNDTATTEIYTLSLHDALPISGAPPRPSLRHARGRRVARARRRSEEHTSELQSRQYLVCRLLLEKKNTTTYENSGKFFKLKPYMIAQKDIIS